MSLELTQVVGLATIQDLGRPGYMHEGLPPGGALVPELLVRANRHALNPDGAAAVEVFGRLTVRARSPLAIATDLRPLSVLNEGDEMTIASDRRRAAYLSIRGGVDAPLVLGSRAAHLSAGLGVRLRTGTFIAPAAEPIVNAAVPDFNDRDDPIRVLPGPDGLDVTALTAGPYIVLLASDRVGTRLQGPRIEATGRGSRPMVIGAIEVPGDGQPIVLGPEHPTTGGYPLAGIIAREDLGRFFAVRIGESVRFVTR